MSASPTGSERRWRRWVGALLAAVVATSTAAMLVLPAPPAAADTSNCDVVPSSAANSNPVSTGVGEDPSPFDFIPFSASIATNFAADEATSGAGWLLNLLLGGHGNQSPTPGEQQILAEVGQMQTQLTGLQTQLTGLANQLTDAEFAIKAQLTRSTYDELVGAETANISTMQTAVENICYLSQNALPYTPDSTDVANVNDLRDNGLKYLNDLSDALLGVNSNGIIGTYSQATWDDLTPSATQLPNQKIMTPAYSASMNALLGYYVGLSVQFFNAYAEAVHWESAAGTNVPGVSQDNPQKITIFWNQLQADINAWTMAATGGVSSVAANTVVDTRTTPYTQWSSAPVSLPGTNAGQYCNTPAPVCSFTVLDPKGTPVLGASRLVPSVAEPMDYLFLGDEATSTAWRTPSTADYTTLVSKSATGIDPNAGVANWAVANALPVLQAQTYALPVGSVTTIPPVMVGGSTSSASPSGSRESTGPARGSARLRSPSAR